VKAAGHLLSSSNLLRLLDHLLYQKQIYLLVFINPSNKLMQVGLSSMTKLQIKRSSSIPPRARPNGRVQLLFSSIPPRHLSSNLMHLLSNNLMHPRGSTHILSKMYSTLLLNINSKDMLNRDSMHLPSSKDMLSRDSMHLFNSKDMLNKVSMRLPSSKDMPSKDSMVPHSRDLVVLSLKQFPIHLELMSRIHLQIKLMHKNQ
jgi:hypothetical protein